MANPTDNAKPTKRGPGRPRKDAPLRVSWKKFERAAVALCTVAECAAYCNISIPTLRSRALKKYGEPLRDTLDRLQDSGGALRKIAQHQLAVETGSGSNAARAAYHGRQVATGRDGVSVTVNIGARQKRLVNRVEDICIIEDSAIIDLVPHGHALVRDSDTGALRLASLDEQSELDEIGHSHATALIPRNGFEFAEDAGESTV